MGLNSADAVVVGGGLNGAATAYFLLKNGLSRVVILESELPCSGASGGAVGLLRTHYDNLPETELAAISMPYFRDWNNLIGGDCGWSKTGFFRFVEPDQIDNMNANIAFQRKFDVKVDVLSADTLGAIAPEFSVEGIGAVLHEVDAGTASNSKATKSLLKNACAIGAEVWPYCRARTINVENGRVTGIETERGRIDTPIVVLAAGAGSKILAATCGVDLPIEARALCVAEIVVPDDLRIPGSFMDPMTNSWISPRDQGRAIISAPEPSVGKPTDPEDYDPEFAREYAEAGLSPVEQRLPGIAKSKLCRWWRRAECFAPDGKPILGGVDTVDGLHLNTAGAGKGHKVAPAIGIAMSELIANGRSTTADLAPFGLNRFAGEPAKWSESEYRQRVIG